MAPGPRLSDKELAAINAAAVTREYTVKPHLGKYSMVPDKQNLILWIFRLQNSICGEWVCLLSAKVV